MTGENRRHVAERLVEEYGPALYGLCFVMLRSAHDAEDAVQDTLLRWLERAPEFASPSAERAWLFTVAANRCRDRLRELKRRPTAELDELSGLCITDEDSHVLAALAALPEKLRIVMLLHCVEGYSVNETAEMLSLTPSCVKMRLKKGRELLGKEIFDGE